MNGKSSRDKGARGEREFRDVLRKHGFEAARTGRSVRDRVDDVSHNIAGVHFEVKRRNGFNPVAWLRQARRDANGRLPVAVWKRNNGEWIALLGADEFLTLLKERARYETALRMISGGFIDPKTHLDIREIADIALEKERPHPSVRPAPPLDTNDSTPKEEA